MILMSGRKPRILMLTSWFFFRLKYRARNMAIICPDDSCSCSAADSHGRTSQQTEYHNGIQNDVNNSTDALGIHVVDGSAGGLKDSLQI
jgi:hypothetical protein